MIATHHVGFTVSDLDRSIEFYSALLGTEPFERRTWEFEYIGRLVGYPGCRLDYAMFHLPETDALLELLQYLSPEGGRVDMETNNVGISHLCLLTSDLDADFARLRKIGADFRSPEPVEVPVGPYKGGKAAYMRDPDGITIELIQLPPLLAAPMRVASDPPTGSGFEKSHTVNTSAGTLPETGGKNPGRRGRVRSRGTPQAPDARAEVADLPRGVPQEHQPTPRSCRRWGITPWQLRVRDAGRAARGSTRRDPRGEEGGMRRARKMRKMVAYGGAGD